MGELQKRILFEAYALINGEMDSWMQLAYEMRVKKLSLEQKIEHGAVDLNEVFTIVEEMTKELGLDKCIWTTEDLVRRLETDKTMTQLEKAYVKQTILLMKWLKEEE